MLPLAFMLTKWREHSTREALGTRHTLPILHIAFKIWAHQSLFNAAIGSRRTLSASQITLKIWSVRPCHTQLPPKHGSTWMDKALKSDTSL